MLCDPSSSPSLHLDRSRTTYNLGANARTPHRQSQRMSYRTFKRVLGETNLERKCRWWFGVSLAVLLTLSFTWYGRRTDQIVDDLNPDVHRPGAGAGRLAGSAHREARRDRRRLERELGEAVATWAQVLQRPGRQQQRAGPRVSSGTRSCRSSRIRAACRPRIGRRTTKSVGCRRMGGAASAAAAGTTPSRRRRRISSCRQARVSRAVHRRARWPPVVSVLSADVRRAVVRRLPQHVDRRRRRTRSLQDRRSDGRHPRDDRLRADGRRAWPRIGHCLWTAAIVVGFVSMFSLWAVVRYVIVKPLTHLRDVGNAVSEGDVEQRADIHTGDEFEELAAAFNRMLRQLVSQQSELRHSQRRARRAARRAGPGQHAALRNEPPQERLPGHHEPRAAHAAQQHPRLQRRARARSTRSTTSRSATCGTSRSRAGCCWK